MKTQEERQRFLSFVKSYIASDPEAAAHISDHVAAGIKDALYKAEAHASTMETVAVALAGKKLKGSEELLISKLKSMRGKTHFNWDWFIGKGPK